MEGEKLQERKTHTNKEGQRQGLAMAALEGEGER